MTQRRNRDKIRDIKGDPRSTTTYNYYLEEDSSLHFNAFIIFQKWNVTMNCVSLNQIVDIFIIKNI